jgi:hypothetical protein
LMRLSSNRKYRLKIDELIKCIEYGVPWRGWKWLSSLPSFLSFI